MWTNDVPPHNQRWDSTQGGNAVCLASIPEVMDPYLIALGNREKTNPSTPSRRDSSLPCDENNPR